MVVKTVKIPENVLAVLSALEFDENHARITAQLDRKLYTAVNDVLVALGGKWTTKVKAHVFAGDAEQAVDAAILAGEVVTEKANDYFPTPAHIARKLVAMVDLQAHHAILEPSAGQGAILEAIEEVVRNGTHTFAVEPMDKNRQVLREKAFQLVVEPDFLNWREPVDRIVMNPPFSKRQDIHHVRHAFSVLRPGGVVVAVMSAGVEFRQDGLSKSFRAFLAEHGGTMERLPALSFRDSGTDVNTVVVRIQKR